MPLTVINQTGDGTVAALIDTAVTLPDSGSVVQIDGRVTPPGGATVQVTGSPLTMPAAPGSGQIFWNIQVDTGTGAASVQQSTTADPAPISGTALVVFRQTLGATSTDPALTAASTPDTW